MDQRVFPQANDFSKVIKLIELTEEELHDDIFLQDYLEVSQRQVNYYLSACEYLRVVKRRQFTDLGKELKMLPIELREKKLIRLVLKEDIFFDSFYHIVFEGQKLNDKEIASYLFLNKVVEKESVACRRASTVNGWTKWIIDKIDISQKH